MYGLPQNRFQVIPPQRILEVAIKLRRQSVLQVNNPQYKGNDGLEFGGPNREGNFSMKPESDVLDEAFYMDEMIIRTVEISILWDVRGW